MNRHSLALSLLHQNSKDMTAMKIIIPVGFNAEQCKRGVISHFTDDITTEWMSKQDFDQQYLYCHEDGDYDPLLEVWLFVWDSPGKMLKPPKSLPSLRTFGSEMW